MGKLEGKAALVTGSARGIGAAIAERLAADGAAVAVNYSRSANEAESVAERIRRAGNAFGPPPQMVAFLASPASRYIAGATIDVDGGMSSVASAINLI